jgi:ATP-dependent Clp protease ATP-binding subunit ClpC
MFERYTEGARRTLFFARFETSAVGGVEIHPEHLLLGLLRGDKSVTHRLFASMDLSYAEARGEILQHVDVQQQLPTSVEIPFSDLTRQILRRAPEEADALGLKEIDSGHLLLALLKEGGSFAAEFLKAHGVTVESVRNDFF